MAKTKKEVEAADVAIPENNAPVNPEATELLKKNFHMFFKSSEYNLDIRGDEDDQVAVIDEAEYPLVDILFQAKIVQPGHVQADPKYKRVMGKIIVVMDEENPELEASDEMNLIPLGVIRQGMRHYGTYDANNSESSNLLCYSSDGFYPSDRVVAPQNHICAEVRAENGKPYRKVVCPCAEWVDGKKPACGESITVAFFDLDRKIPVQMEMHGGAIGAWRKLSRAYAQTKQVTKLRRKSIYDYYVNLTVENEGTYVRPVFKLVESTPESPFGKTTKWRDLALYYLRNVCPVPQVRIPGVEQEESTGTTQTAIASAEEVSEAQARVVEGQAFDL